MPQTDLQRCKDELFNILLVGDGLQSLLTIVSSKLKKSVTLCTTNFSIIASTLTMQQAIRFRHEKGGRFLTGQSISMMQAAHLIDKMQDSWRPLFYHFADEPDRDYLFIGIHIRKNTIAYLCLDGPTGSMVEKDGLLLAELAKAVAIEMQKAGCFQEKSGRSQEYLLIDLLKGNIRDYSFVQQRLDTFGIKSVSWYKIAVAANTQETPATPLKMFYIQQLSTLFPNSLTAFHDGSYVILMSGTPSVLACCCQTKQLEQFAAMNHLRIGISYVFNDIAAVASYYQQALFASQDSADHSQTVVRHYDACMFQHLCSFIMDTAVLSAMVHPDIMLLQQHDIEHNTAYIATINAYFAAGRNAAQAANLLHIHKSTFFYRLDKIRACTGFAIDDESILFSYELSLHILHNIS